MNGIFSHGLFDFARFDADDKGGGGVDKHKEAVDKALDELEKSLETVPDEQKKKILETINSLKTATGEERTTLLGVITKERDLNKGFSDKVKRLDDLEKAEAERKKLEMTEVDKAKAEAQAALDEKAKADLKAEQAEKALKQTKLEFAVSTQALKMNFKDPNDVLALANGEFAKVEFSDEGKPDEKKIVEILEKLAKDKPYLIGEAKTQKKGTPSQTDKSGGKAQSQSNSDDGDNKPRRLTSTI